MADWDQELFNQDRYAAVFEELRRRARERPSLLDTAPVHREYTLRWLLAHESQVIAAILSSVGRPDFALDTHWLDRVHVGSSGGGKMRELFVASWPDRVLLMVMGRIFAEEFRPALSTRIFSFQAGRGPWDALQEFAAYLETQKGRNALYVIRRDIRSYGDSISQSLLLKQLEERTDITRSRHFWRIFVQAIRAPFRWRTAPNLPLVHLWRGIPSGSPLVPQLENFYLGKLDEALSTLDSGAFYARYGDDFLLATPCLETAREAREVIRQVVGELQLSIAPEKELDFSINLGGRSVPTPLESAPFVAVQGVEWLGMRVNREGRLGCKREHFARIRTTVAREIDRLVAKSYRLRLSRDARVRILRGGIQQLCDPKKSPALQRLVFQQRNEEVLRLLDRFFVERFVRSLCRHGKLGRHEAWKLFRRLGFRSLLHQYRAHHFHRKDHRKDRELLQGRCDGQLSSQCDRKADEFRHAA